MRILIRLLSKISYLEYLFAGKIFNVAKTVTNTINPFGIIRKLTSHRGLLSSFQNIVSTIIAYEIQKQNHEINLIYAEERKNRPYSYIKDFFLICTTYLILGCAMILVIFHKNKLSNETLHILYTIIGISMSCVKDIIVQQFGRA